MGVGQRRPRAAPGCGRDLAADRPKVAIYLLVSVAAILRVIAAGGNFSTLPLLEAAAAWIAAFALFVFHYGPMQLRPRHRG